MRHRGSNLSPTSELYVTAQVFADSKPLAVHAQTRYRHFKNARAWNEWLQLPLDYALLPLNAQLAITVWDLSPVGTEGARGHHIPFGGTTISLFDHDGTLRKGRQKCRLWRHKAADGFTDTTTPWAPKKGRRGQEEKHIFADDKHSRRTAELDRLHDLLKKHEMKDIPEVKWLDQMVFRQIERMERSNIRDDSKLLGNHDNTSTSDNHDTQDAAAAEEADTRNSIFYLYIEFPRFDHPVVFTDHEYPPPPISARIKANNAPGSDVRLKPPPEVQFAQGIDTRNPGYGDPNGTHLIRIYDPEVGKKDNPAQRKHTSLVKDQRIGMLDRHLKPNTETRKELDRIMSYGPTTELNNDQKNKVFKFRYHLTRDKRVRLIHNNSDQLM